MGISEPQWNCIVKMVHITSVNTERWSLASRVSGCPLAPHLCFVLFLAAIVLAACNGINACSSIVMVGTCTKDVGTWETTAPFPSLWCIRSGNTVQSLWPALIGLTELLSLGNLLRGTAKFPTILLYLEEGFKFHLVSQVT